MKLNCGRTARERLIERLDRKSIRSFELSKWHKWFAWYPIRIGYRDCRWLEYIERKANIINSFNYTHSVYYTEIYSFSYRAKGNHNLSGGLV